MAKKLKVGIITFHNANNIGAILQAYALQTYLSQNYNAEIINFIPNNECSGSKFKDRMIIPCKRFIYYIVHRKEYKRQISFNNIRSKMNISKRRYYGDKDILNNPPKYDVIISGSDQILNTTLTGNSKGYYLFFTNHSVKVTYGSSFGRENISTDEISLIKTELPKFKYLSAREETGQRIIEYYTGRKPELVLDPVFLMDKGQWMNLFKGETNLKGPYIFVYMMENSDALMAYTNALKAIYGYTVIIVNGAGVSNNKIDGDLIIDCGPSDFLRYIYNAAIVVTNSFHGTAFSIIFEKDFYTVEHSSRNTRIENLLNLAGANGKCLPNQLTHINDLTKYVIYGKKCATYLLPYKNKSKEYLIGCISGLGGKGD